MPDTDFTVGDLQEFYGAVAYAAKYRPGSVNRTGPTTFSFPIGGNCTVEVATDQTGFVKMSIKKADGDTLTTQSGSLDVGHPVAVMASKLSAVWVKHDQARNKSRLHIAHERMRDFTETVKRAMSLATKEGHTQ